MAATPTQGGGWEGGDSVSGLFSLDLPVDARHAVMELILTAHGALRVEVNVVAVISLGAAGAAVSLYVKM